MSKKKGRLLCCRPAVRLLPENKLGFKKMTALLIAAGLVLVSIGIANGHALPSFTFSRSMVIAPLLTLRYRA